MKKLTTKVLCFIIVVLIIFSTTAFSTVSVKSIQFDKSGITLDVGKTYNLKFTFTPSNTAQTSLLFSTSNKKVATVNNKGKITAVSNGVAVITATSALNAKISTTCKVTVYQTDNGSKQITITYYTPNLTEWPKDAASEKLEKDLNVKIVVKNDPNWDFSQLRQYIASGDIPDLFYDVIPDRINDIYNFRDQGIIREWPMDLISQYPDLQSLFNSSTANVTKQLSKGMGTDKIYAFPQIISKSRIWNADFSSTGMIYRKDWVHKLGLDAVVEKNMTMDQFYALLKDFTTKDPDGNGKNDTYGLVTGFRLTSFLQVWGIRSEEWKYDPKDGLLKPNYLSDAMIEPLKWLQKAYTDGLIDPEMISNTSQTTVNQKFGSDKFGVMFCNGEISALARAVGPSASAKAYGATHSWDLNYPDYKDDHNISEMFGTLKPLKVNASTEPTYGPLLEYMGCLLSSKVTDPIKLQRIVKMADYLINDKEYYTLSNWGVKGVHYDVKDGKNYPLVDPKTNVTYDNEIASIMSSRDIANCFGGDKDPIFNLTNKTPAIKAMVNKNAADFNAIKKYINVDYTLSFMNFPFRAQYALNVPDYEADLGAMIVDKKVGVEKAFKAWRDNILANNSDRFTTAADLGKKMKLIK